MFFLTHARCAMLISGLQKLSLLDYPDGLCCTLFTFGCNFRCPFCHNASLVLPQQPLAIIEPEEVFRFLALRRGRLDAVCLSGGEPLLQPDIEHFIRQVKAMGFAVKLDTNGSLPQRLEALLHAGLLDYVAMDIKAPAQGYAAAIGLENYDAAPVRHSARLLMEGSVPYEFRSTLVQGLHTPADMQAIGAWLQGAPRYYLQMFVPSPTLIRPGLQALPPQEMQACLDVLWPYIPGAALRGA